MTTSVPHAPRLRDGAGSAGWTALTFAVGLAIFVAFVGPAPSEIDTGFIANAGLRVRRGDVPYRDFFSLVTPLSFFYNALIVAVAGTSLYAIGVGGAVVLAAAYATVFLLAREFLALPWALATWAIAAVFSSALYGVETSYSMLAAAFAFAAALQVARAIRRGQRWRMAVAGALVGLSFWSKQTVGAYVVASLAIYAIVGPGPRASRRDVALAAAGFAGVSALFVGYLVAFGALGDFVQDCFVTPYRHFAAEFRLPPPSPTDVGWQGRNFEANTFYASIGVVLLAIRERLRERAAGAEDAAALFLTIFAGCLLAITLERFSIQNLLCVFPPLVVLLAHSVARLAAERGVPARVAAAALVLGLAVLVATAAGYATFHWRHRDVAGQAARIARTRAFFAAHASGRAMLLPALPLYYFTAGARNPTRFDIAFPGNLSDADRDELAAALATRVDHVFFADGRVDGRSFDDYQPLISDVLAREFVPVALGPHGEAILERRRTPPP